MQPYSIGIDIGTGSTKACAVSLSGHVLASAQQHYTTLPSGAGYAEQDPELIWNAFTATVQDLVKKMEGAPQLVSLSSCMHSLILVDTEGELLTPNITWADRRSAAIAATLRASAGAEEIYRSSGTPLHAMSPLCKLRWFYEKKHGLFKKIAKAISIKEFIWHKLFGQYEIDYSLASATGLFNINTLQWLPLSLSYCGIQPAQLSTPVPTRFIRSLTSATIANLLHLPLETPVCIGASDGCLANVGSQALQPGTAAVTIGTSGAVRICSPQPIAIFPDMIFNYCLDDNHFICGGAINNGGNLVQWLIQQFLGKQILDAAAYDLFFKEVNSVPVGSDGLLCLPYLYGERTPIWDEQACGAFFGIRAAHQQAHFMRAGLEGICFALHGILKKLEEKAGPIAQLHVSGGMVHAPVWMQLLADVTGKTLYLLHTEDASAIGAALLGMKAAGLTKDYTFTEAFIEKKIFANQANHLQYRSRIPLFEELYATLKPLMQRI